MRPARRHPASSRRGFTLVELLVASTISVIAISAGSAAMIGQYRAMQSLDLTRGANTTNRGAMLQLEESLRVLGWGIDPRYALDFQMGCPATGTCRDHNNAPDELAFVARNPSYRYQAMGEGTCTNTNGCFTGNAWFTTSVDTTAHTLTLTLPTTTTLEAGRILLATCQGGQTPVMVQNKYKTVGTGNNQTLTFNAPSLPVLPYNNPLGLQACHGQAGAAVFLVDRYHYYVATYGNDPWLMLDTSLDVNGDGVVNANDQIPVAKDVEDMQVAYVIPSSPVQPAPDSNKDWIVGNDSSASSAEEPNPALSAPTYSTASDATVRFNLHPANVRGIRVSLRIRSNRVDQSRGLGWAGDTINTAENRKGTLSGGGYRRYTAETEISLRNLESKNSFVF